MIAGKLDLALFPGRIPSAWIAQSSSVYLWIDSSRRPCLPRHCWLFASADGGCDKRMASFVALIRPALRLRCNSPWLSARPSDKSVDVSPQIRHNGERVFALHEPRFQVPGLFSNDDAGGRQTHSFIESNDSPTTLHPRCSGKSHFKPLQSREIGKLKTDVGISFLDRSKGWCRINNGASGRRRRTAPHS